MPDNWWDYPVSKNVLLKKGHIINAESTQVGDVWIKNGKIQEVSSFIDPDEDTLVISVEGMLVLPGGIDPNTHLDFEFMENKTVDDYYYGTRAAVSGGTTTIIDFVVPEIGEGLEDAYKKIRKIADFEVVCDYGLHMVVNYWNNQVKRQMGQVVIGCGINSFMLYMGYKDDFMLTDSEIYQACLKCRQLGALAMIHPVNGSIVAENIKRLQENGVKGVDGHYKAYPDILEAEGINRACIITEQVQCPLYICNIMSNRAANVLKDKKQNGYNAFGETIAAALGTIAPGSDASFKVRSAYIMSPAISRNPDNPKNLMKHLTTNVLTTTASCNCTFSNEQKARGKYDFTKIPHGVNGVEDRMSVVWQKGVKTGMMTLSQFVAVTSTNAAKLFNLYPKKGVIAEGSDADVVVWNPNRYRKISHYNHRHLCDYNIFHGMKIEGGPEYVFVRGKMCVDGDILRVRRGYGNYLFAACYSTAVYQDKTVSDLQRDMFTAD